MRTNLKLLRVKHKLTQAQMAVKLYCARCTYAAIETGERNGSRQFWQTLQKVFNIPDSEMWELQKQDEE